MLKSGDEALLIGAAEALGDEPPTPARARELLADPCFVAVTVLVGEAPVGLTYGHVLPQLTRTALLIYSVDTAESHRRKGVARAMVEELRSLCMVRGYYEMWVPTSASNEPAMALYAACGGVRDAMDDVIFAFPTPG
jgi:GNAT superfamily N-acetyltransferase